MRNDDQRKLKEQRLHAVAELREINDRAERERRDLTAAEQRRWNELTASARRIELDLEAASEPDWKDGYRPSVGGEEYGDDPLLVAFRKAGFARGNPAEIGWPEYRAVTWTGSVDNLSPLRREGVPLGHDQRYAYRAFPQMPVESDVTALQIPRQSARTLAAAASVVRAIDAITAKPETGSTLELLTIPMKQVASVQSGVPNVLLESNQLASIVRQDLGLAISEGLDQLVLDGVTPSGFQAPGTDPLPVSIRKAISTILASGYSPDTVVLRPADSEAIDTSRDSAGQYLTGLGQFGPDRLYGCRVFVSKTAAWPFVADSQALGRMYASPVRLATFEQDAGSTNRSTVRLELNAAFGVERQAAAIRISAT